MKVARRIWDWLWVKNLRFDREHPIQAVGYATVFLAFAAASSLGYIEEQVALPLWILGGGLLIRTLLVCLFWGDTGGKQPEDEEKEKKHLDSQTDQ